MVRPSFLPASRKVLYSSVRERPGGAEEEVGVRQRGELFSFVHSLSFCESLIEKSFRGMISHETGVSMLPKRVFSQAPFSWPLVALILFERMVMNVSPATMQA